MTHSKSHIAFFLGIAAVAWWLTLLANGTSVTWKHAAPFGTVVSVLALTELALVHVLWRQPCLHGWFIARPDLRGTWRVELRLNLANPQAGETSTAIVCYMGVTQTFSRLQMHLMTSESESWLLAESIRRSPSGGGYEVAGIYTNEPRIGLRGDRSEIHRGAFVLNTHGCSQRPKTMTGEYWTDRKTSGEMDFTTRIPKLATRFDEAERLHVSG